MIVSNKGVHMFWDNFLTKIRSKWRPAKATTIDADVELRAEPIVVGIDIGTTKIAAVVARIDSDFPKILGVARISFNGVTWTKNNQSEITGEAVNSAVKEACKASGCSTRSATIGISGLTTGKNTIGEIQIKRQLFQQDVQRAIAAATDSNLPEDMVILDQVINSFNLDGRRVANPLDATYSNLEALTHIITCRRTVFEVVTTACKQAGIDILKMAASEIASASVLLTQEDKTQGVCLLDIGGEYTSIVVYVSGALRYSASVPWGGNHLTSCIGLQLGLDKVEAEKVKKEYSRNNTLNSADEQSKAVHDLLDKKLWELCTLLNVELNTNGLKGSLGAGIVLTGGTSNLPGLPEVFERGFELPVRLAEFQRLDWLDNISLEYASAVGLVSIQNDTWKQSI
jgi:cell division protein FtsA